MILQRPLTQIGVGVAVLSLATATALGCGINWFPPYNHFDGVNERGELSYWQNIGELDLGDGLKIPLIMGFNSARNSNSPYLGEGWVLALLESNVVQVDAKHFMMVQPDGYSTAFSRKKETDTVLHGWGGWMGQIDGDTITVWAKCGWKIIFTQGKISSITTPQNHQLTYVYQNNIVKEIDKDHIPALTVNTDGPNGEVSGLTLGKKEIQIKLGPKPRIDDIGGQNVVGEVASSLKQLTLEDGSVEDFKFAVTPKLIPTLDISGGKIISRSFSWDPLSRRITSDGDWTYKIVPGTSAEDAQITRINKERGMEYWYLDKKDGQETSLTLDGTKEIKETFTSGLLKGQLRKIEQIKNNVISDIYTASYDETGHLIREQKGDTLIIYDSLGRVVQLYRKGELIWHGHYDTNGKLVNITFEN